MIPLLQLSQKPHTRSAAGLMVQVYLQLIVHGACLQLRFQDAIKKTSKDELPDFYNIQLERPKDDAKGYDVLFIDAASKVACPDKHPIKHSFTAGLGLAHLHHIHYDIMPTKLHGHPVAHQPTDSSSDNIASLLCSQDSSDSSACVCAVCTTAATLGVAGQGNIVH